MIIIKKLFFALTTISITLFSSIEMAPIKTTIRLYSIYESFGAQTQELKKSTEINYNSLGKALDSTLYNHSIPLSEKYVYVTGPSEGVRLHKTYDRKKILSYRFIYNSAGQRISTALHGADDSLFWKEFFKYDNQNRLIKTIRYNPNRAINSENMLQKDQSGKLIWGENYNYDSTGTILEKEEVYDGHVLEVSNYRIDNVGVPEKKAEYFDPSVIFRTIFFHNEFDQLINETTVGRFGKSEGSKSYEYDGFGRIIKSNYYNSNGLLTETLKREYREMDFRISEFRIDSSGSTISEIETRLDVESRPFIKALIDNQNRLTEKQVFHYDKLNRVISIKSYDMLRRGKNDNEIPMTVTTYEYE